MLTIMGIAAAKSGINISGARVHVVKEMVAVPVRRIGELKVTITLPKGLKLDNATKAKFIRAADLCPVKQSLHPDVHVSVKFIYE
jgi:putative redox protein